MNRIHADRSPVKQHRPLRLPPGVTNLNSYRVAKAEKKAGWREEAASCIAHAAKARAEAALPTFVAAQRFREKQLRLATTFETMATEYLHKGGAL